MENKAPLLAILIPCFNEEEGIRETIYTLLNLMDYLYKKGKIKKDSFILLVDDGSTDNTWEIIKTESNKSKLFPIKAIQLDKNYGPQTAILAGYEYLCFNNNVDCVVSIDADLQQDETKIEEMIDKYIQGYDIILGIREGKFRKTSSLFYKIMKLLKTPIIENHSEYRLISKRVLKNLCKFQERNFFLRGIVAQLTGYPTFHIKYKVKDRKYGSSRYLSKRVIEDVIDAITSYTYVPLRLIAILGFLVTTFSILMTVYTFYLKLSGKTEISGWASLMISIWFLGGIIMMALGIIGEYLGKIYMEVKKRPRYFIKEKI